MNSKIRNEVFERDNYTCIYCGASGENIQLEVDHIIPVSKGGTNDINNLVTACMTCNRSKHATILSVDDLQVLAEKIDSSLDFLLSLIDKSESGEIRTVKITAYVTQEMAQDIKDLAHFKKMSVASLVVNSLDEYIKPRREQIHSMRELEKGL